MNILLISSSPHKEKSQTFLLAKEVLKGFSSAVKTEIIHLSDYKIGFCRHCESCHKKILRCPIKDDAMMILKKMLKAQGIIFVSPNYIHHITASMKALLDRAGYFIHCRGLFGKYVLGVVSSGSGENQPVLDYIHKYANICGAQYSGGVSSCRPVSNEVKEEAFNLGGQFVSDIRENIAFPEQMKFINDFKENFRETIQKRKNDWVEEYQYWLDKGWL
jgi:multimeric flavodoxin WrbA